MRESLERLATDDAVKETPTGVISYMGVKGTSLTERLVADPTQVLTSCNGQQTASTSVLLVRVFSRN